MYGSIDCPWETNTNLWKRNSQELKVVARRKLPEFENIYNLDKIKLYAYYSVLENTGSLPNNIVDYSSSTATKELELMKPALQKP